MRTEKPDKPCLLACLLLLDLPGAPSGPTMAVLWGENKTATDGVRQRGKHCLPMSSTAVPISPQASQLSSVCEVLALSRASWRGSGCGEGQGQRGGDRIPLWWTYLPDSAWDAQHPSPKHSPPNNSARRAHGIRGNCRSLNGMEAHARLGSVGGRPCRVWCRTPAWHFAFIPHAARDHIELYNPPQVGDSA